ncbi:MAG: ABC transporter ATP-binding protein [Dehalococcoidia bacterium]|nr:ABC transporter ATP-binding protein [Dehalococcoidia bacterium]
MKSSHTALQLDRISFQFGSNLVLEDVSLEVRPGEFIVLLGPNGAGKSTLIRLIVGLLRPNAGEINLFGTPIGRFKDWPRIGYVPQLTSTRPGFPATVDEVVASGRTGKRGLLRRLTHVDRVRIDSALDAAGVAPFRDRLISNLSGGQHQRVMLARALAGEPELLLLDEPAAGVDAATKGELLRILKGLCEAQGIAVVYVSHDWETLRPFATKAAWLDRRLLFFGSWEDMDEGGNIRQLGEIMAASEHFRHEEQ